ncbi:MAG: SpoIIIAH-like family protein [Lachnospiraceae bacterium]|nr:SpoIIIAH-like family protein [Lachnospiraceae bacterium]
MKGKFKKNQIVITTLALMIAIAGYLDFAGTEIGQETAMTEGVVDDNMESADSSDIASDISMEDIYAESESEETGDAVVVGDSSEEAEENSAEASTTEDIESYDFDLTSNTTGEEEIPGEAVLTNGSAASVSDVVSEARLTREQVRSKNKEALLEVINNSNITDNQKQAAIDNMISLTDIAEKEAAAEMLLEAKGYTDAVVSITDGSVDVVVNMAEVDDAGRAQIEDIVKRKTGASAENIVITPIHTH